MVNRRHLMRKNNTVLQRIMLALCVGIICAILAGPIQAQNFTLLGASQFNEDHPVTITMREFERLVTECYSGEVDFNLIPNAGLGLERDYFDSMSRGVLDYAVVSPGNMSHILPQAALLEAPFLFGSVEHLEAVLAEGALDQFANDVLEQANVHIIGYAGGGTRNTFANRPLRSVDDLAGLSIRVPSAPIWPEVFHALGASPTMTAYSEIYNALQTGGIAAAENEATGIAQMRFYDVAPEVTLTQHAIAIRPLAVSNSTYQSFDDELRNCIDEVGPAAGQYGRNLESAQNAQDLQMMVDEGFISINEFPERTTLFDITQPILLEYANSLGAADLFYNITAACPRYCEGSCDNHHCHACRICRN